jgi:hypothetical protein
MAGDQGALSPPEKLPLQQINPATTGAAMNNPTKRGNETSEKGHGPLTSVCCLLTSDF